MRGLVTKFAVRSLGRNMRRTLLSVLGVGVGCAVALYISAFLRGSSDLRVRSIAESGFGHLQVVPGGWEETRDPDLRLEDWRRDLRAARGLADVRVAAPRARAMGLVAFGTRSAGVEIVGVDPEAEPGLNRLVRAIGDGRYLAPDDRGAAVVGRTIVERLGVELDDDLFLTVVGRDGGMEYAMLRIVGIVDTGSRDIDASICHVVLEDVERLTGHEGAGEIAVLLDDRLKTDRVVSRLQAAIPGTDAVLTWKEILPGQGGDLESDEAFMNLMAGIVLVVVILGVAGAQLTAVLERKREFAVLMALGVRGLRVVQLLLTEAVALGLLGAAAGLVIGTPFVYHAATRGIDFTSLLGGDFSISGVLFDPVLYARMGLWMIPHALAVAVASALLAALYPAWFAVRTDPRSALSLREG